MLIIIQLKRLNVQQFCDGQMLNGDSELWKHSEVDIKLDHEKCNHMLAT